MFLKKEKSQRTPMSRSLNSMNVYLLAGLVILVANIMPAFAPPTWTILVFFVVTKHPYSVALIVEGVLAAVLGRFILANAFRRFRSVFPKRYVANMRAAGDALTKTRGRAAAVLALFLISPISSAQLFEAAGLMPQVKLRPLLIAFGAGRIISYSIYVSSAHALAATSLGALVVKYITSPQAIAIEVSLVIGLVALGSIDWMKVGKQKT